MGLLVIVATAEPEEPAARKVVCRDVHDLSLLLTEICELSEDDEDKNKEVNGELVHYLGREARIEEGLARPVYYVLADTGIEAGSMYSEICVWLPKHITLPLPSGKFASLQDRLNKISVDLDHEPEMLDQGIQGVWNYTLWRQGATRSYKKMPHHTKEYHRTLVEEHAGNLGWIRNNEDTGKAYLNLDYKNIKDREQVEKIIEAVVETLDIKI